MFKRILAASLAACMIVLSLTACGGSETANTGESSVASQTDTTVSQVASETAQTSSTATAENTSSAAAAPQGGEQGTVSGGNKATSSAKTKTTSSGTAAAGSKRITIWWPAGDESLLAAAKEYEKIDPSVYIDVQTPTSNTVENLKVAIAAQQEPNIVMLDHVYITALGRSGQLLNLNKFGASSIASKYIDSCWEGVSFGAKNVYGLPHNGNTICLMYNRDYFTSAGIKSAPKNWKEFQNTGKKLEAVRESLNKKAAFTSPFFDTADQGRKNWSAFVYFFWLWRNGGDILNSSNTKATFNSAAGKSALSMLTQLTSSGICYKTGYLESEFYNGDVGMIEMGNWQYPNVVSQTANANFGVSTLPTLKNGVTNWSGLGLYALGITKRTKYAKEAYDFIKFYTTDDRFQLQYGQQHYQLPVTVKALQNNYYTGSSFWKTYIAQYKYSKSRPGVDKWDQIEAKIAEAVNSAIKDPSKVNTALDQAAKQVNALLK